MILITSKSPSAARREAERLAEGKAVRLSNSYKVPDCSGNRTYEFTIVS